MLDATQATVVAYMTEHGEIIHESHLPDEVLEQAEQAALDAGEPRGVGWRIFDESVRDQGYTALIRYSISEMESERAFDVEHYPDGYDDVLAETIERRNALRRAIERIGDNYGPDDRETVEDWLTDLDDEIEANVEALSKVHCDNCGDPIE